MYICLDTETTAARDDMRKPENMLMLSMVYEDPQTTKDIPVWQLPHFTALVVHEKFQGEAIALGMNGWIFEIIGQHQRGKPTKYPVLTLSNLTMQACEWVKRQGKGKRLIPVGQNVGSFDLRFLPQELQKTFHYRSMEIGSLFGDAVTGPKSLAEVKRACGFGDRISHNAYHEAMDYILCLRTRYNGNTTPYDISL